MIMQNHTVKTQQVSAGTASYSGEDNLMSHTQEGQWSAISVMCTNLDIPASDLLMKDVTTYHTYSITQMHTGT